MDELRKRQKIISQLVEPVWNRAFRRQNWQGGWESSAPASTVWKVGHRTPRSI